VYDWYQDTNPSSSHNAAKGLYENKTGDWIFRTPSWEDWVDARIRALWIHGIPGAGKTVLASHIIEATLRICEAKDKRTTCVYYYCYHGHNQDESVSFLRWLVSQLLRTADIVPTLAFKAYTHKWEPDTSLLLDVLDAALVFFDRVYVAIDALDESQLRQNLLRVLSVLATDPRFLKIQLLATSREHSDIELQMCRFSKELSMSNSFVEADIKIYVAAKIMAEPKFQRWPSDLRADVETTLSTGAKGMFRWAVCQLDILRRLNRQSKIREAIKSLPKTMDETYERIFSSIPDEERELVRHALLWVSFHNFVWKGSVPLPAQLLVDSYIALDKARISSDEYLYDLETLKDSCGCLVSFTSNEEDISLSANISHYTVREFLESDRSSLASFFTIQRKASYRMILDFVLEYAITSEPSEILGDWCYSPLNLSSSSSLQEYCLAASVRSLRELEDLVEPRLAFRFLDPLGAHFNALQESIRGLKEDGNIDILSCDHYMTGLWSLNWEESTKHSKTAILANLLLIECFDLAKEFIQELHLESILQETLYGSIKSPIGVDFPCPGDFECNIIELLAEIGKLDEVMLDFCQRELGGLVCYDNFLPCYMPCHALDEFGTAYHGSCVLLRLLQLGANPDPEGFQVTPLQIAVFLRDLPGVKTLLEAGADPNNTGNEQGIKWHAQRSILGSYCHLHGLAPLYILRHLKPFSKLTNIFSAKTMAYVSGPISMAIERSLLDYKALPVSID
jgi:hypothetical protein